MEEPAQPRQTDAPSAELGFALPEPARLSRGRAITFFVLGAVVLGGVFVSVLLPKNAARASLEQETRAKSGAALRLAVAPGKLVSSERVLKLPASVQPLEEAVVYARANGYVARWLVDLGDKVKADQLLLEIETPEINQELAQAKAALAKAQAAKAQAEAGRALSKSRFDRTGKLVDAGVASQAELEQTQAESSVGDANINVAQAAIDADNGAGDIGSALAGEKRNHVAIFFRLTVTAHRNTARALGQHILYAASFPFGFGFIEEF